MMAHGEMLRIGTVVLDLARACLRREDGSEVTLRPKSLDLLAVLARNAGGVVTGRRCSTPCAPGIYVTEDSVTQCVREVRRAIGDPEGQLLRTVPKRGYMLDVAVAPVAPVPPASAPIRIVERPSLVVLPFAVQPGDEPGDWFADGVAEEITTALSRFRSLLVIARASAFVFKGRSPDPREVAERLGVRYLLDGSVRRAGGRVRITGRLVVAESGAQLWADRFEAGEEDLFLLQDRVTSAVAAALEPRIRAAEIERATRKPTTDRTAYDLFLQALPAFRTRTPAGNAEAKRLLQLALEQDQGFAQACALLARTFENGAFQGWEPDYRAATQTALDLARQSLALDATDPAVLAASGYILAVVGGVHDEGAALIDRAIEANPNHAEAFLRGAWVSVWCGAFDQALARVEAAERLDPISSELVAGWNARAAAHFFSRRFEAAIAAAERALGRSPDYNAARRYLAAALARLGRESEARAQVAEILRRDPRSSLARSRSTNPFRHDWMMDLYIEGLREAGLPLA